ncbi:hypothetical protein HYW35_04375 [Candidatus Saccharibacteria bacterium]|nr:hypothetical protein [Candidatus Saccharibacteria bacterium]
MSPEQKPKVPPPLKSYTRLLIGLAVLIVLMFVMIGVIIVRVTGTKT